ncbi:MAG TPA: NYN domain-containing protein [Caldisericia bacterium]|nr:NYN domain-containing protein [Caldisericia bacterium]HPF49653.1 NYN domain-containing protein [Caldisericia bacterium]HPI84636.1 NYN domain-containing protein [Caldisericia bacterium]HPQ93690.1 NYN domain-containing protein [Caldisericia bacterium]HRV74747.1 NYN domain-containing protein [Caldisericia bacterium]
MNRIANFIDGGYLDALLRNEFPGRLIDFQKLSMLMTGEFDLLRSYYYHCPPYEVENPTDKQKQFYDERGQYLKRIEGVPRFENRLGQLQYRGKDEKGKPIFEQKRVDLMFGVDLVLLSTKRLITHASILAGDSDFIPAIEVVKREGVVVNLFCGKTPHHDLKSAVDQVTIITKEIMDEISIPMPLQTSDAVKVEPKPKSTKSNGKSSPDQEAPKTKQPSKQSVSRPRKSVKKQTQKSVKESEKTTNKSRDILSFLKKPK